MPIIALEDVTSRRLSSRLTAPSEERDWNLMQRGGTDPIDMDAAEIALLSFSPFAVTTLDQEILIRSDWNLEPNGRRWAKGTVVYTPYDPANGDGPQAEGDVSFVVSGDSTHIQTALKTSGKYVKQGETPADFQGALNVDSDGNVGGTDIVARHLTFPETHYQPFDVVTPAWIKTMASIVGCMNDAPFRSFNRGELLLVGLSGSKNYEKKRWDITYSFDASPNVSNLQIGEIVVEQKLGHDYLWVRYKKKSQAVGGRKLILPQPIQANVEQVYQFADFSRMGIGT